MSDGKSAKVSKRQHARRPLAVDVRAAQERAGDLIFESLDLSIGGAFLRSDLLLELGDQLELAIPLGHGDAPIRALGRVVWVTRDAKVRGNAGMGIEFVDISDLDRERLSRFLELRG